MSDHVLSSVAAEIAAGYGLSMSKVARRIGVNQATASRWVSQGLPDGRGRIFFTSKAALARFFEGLRNRNHENRQAFRQLALWPRRREKAVTLAMQPRY